MDKATSQQTVCPHTHICTCHKSTPKILKTYNLTGLTVYILRDVYNIEFEMPISRVAAQAILNEHTTGISTYTYTHLYFGFNNTVADLQEVERGAGSLILETMEKAYHKFTEKNKELDPKIITTARITARVDPPLSLQLNGPPSIIIPSLQL